MAKKEKCIATGKRRYSSEGEAIEILKMAKRNTNEQRRGRNIPTRYWECEDCGGWHLSSKAQGYGVSLGLADAFKKFLKE